MLYVGLDVHSKQSSLCILNAAGVVVNQIQLKGPRSTVVDHLRRLQEPFSICYEASCGYGHLYKCRVRAGMNCGRTSCRGLDA